MWKEIARFELKYQLRQPLLAASSLVFFALGFALASSDVGLALGGSAGTTLRNAPIVVLRMMPILSLLGLFVITAFGAGAALRDFERRSDALFFTKPLTRFDYLAGRFTGSMFVSLLVLLAGALGLVAGQSAPWQDATRLGPWTVLPHVFGLLTLLIPNLLIMGALVFALAVRTRRMTWAYLFAVLFIGMQDAVEILAQSLDNRVLGSLLEPSGLVVLDTVSRYWTVAEQNARLPELGGVLLLNRLLWLGLAGMTLAWSLRLVREGSSRTRRNARREGGSRTRRHARRALETDVASSESTSERGFQASAIPRQRASRKATGFSLGTAWRQLALQTRLEVSEVVPKAAFLTLLALGLMIVMAIAWTIGVQDGTPALPQTHLMLQAIQLGVRLTLVMILLLYAGELVFSQRSLKISEVYDALPVPSGIFLGAKILALTAIIGLFLLAAATSTILVQLVRGFWPPDLWLYARGLLVIAWPLVLLAVLAIFLQVLFNNKLAGLLATLVAVLLRFALPRLGFEDNLYLYGNHPPIRYSAFDGYGHHAEPFVAFMLYWSAVALGLIVGARLLWPRGTASPLRERLLRARTRLDRTAIASLTVGLLGLGLTGTWIVRNTHAEYLDRPGIAEKMADYERRYQSYQNLPLPRVTAVSVEVDLYPSTRQAEIRGRYRLENHGDETVEVLPITLPVRWVEGALPGYGGVTLEHLEIGGREPERRVDDPASEFYVVALDRPLLPDEAIDFDFRVRIDHQAFRNRRHNDLILENGTFFSGRNALPHIGYASNNQLWNPVQRKKYGLSSVEQALELDRRSGFERNYIEADWIAFEATLSTEADQIAIAPGHLEQEWTEGGRRYFQYKTSAPIIHLLPFLSGRYQVARETFEGVELEIYHHPDHGMNVDRFLETTKTSLAYMTQHFGPYPHKTLRIVEIPNYHGEIAFAFPQVIAFTEVWSWTADLDAGDLDWLTAILAHEIAHQWWNHQVVPAHLQGATMVAESLPQYAAMQILDAMYGPHKVRRFLKFHLDRYLDQRGTERVREMPLAQVENQGYIHYSKASLAFYALKEQVGADVLNGALRTFLESYTFAGPPYPTSADLLDHLRAAIPEHHHPLLVDLFDTITLFDNRVMAASYVENDDGTFDVTIETSSKKLRDDGFGKVTELELADAVDIGIFGENEEGLESVLLFENHHVKNAANTFTFNVADRPLRAGIDPYNKLIDRDSGDNVRPVRRAARR